jgi:hypothetical protein
MSSGLPRLLSVAAVLFLTAARPLSATSLNLLTFQEADGAIVLIPGGNYVEPYFATKALIVAEDSGLDVRQSAWAWINWALPRQRPDGLFRRFCRSKNSTGDWRNCAPADADDSMLALWVQLLYRMAPDSRFPMSWQRSAALSLAELEKLRNRRLGVYHVSRRNHVALLMDNVEVYAALQDVGRGQRRLNDPAAETTEERAEELRKSIERVFWSGHAAWFQASMQKDRKSFYPDAVAQVYPWLAGIAGLGQDPLRAWGIWKREFGPGWIERRYDPAPWGLVAVAADKLGDTASAACWTSQSSPLRGGPTWNVLDEAIWQSLQAQFSQLQLLDPKACAGLLTPS